MRSEIQYISDLLYKYCSGEVLSDEELSDLNSWLNVSETNSDVLKKVQDTGKLQTDLKMWSAFNQEVEDAWVEFNGKVNETQFARPVHRLHLLRTAWFRYAAAVIIVFGIGSYLYVKNQKESPSVTQTNPVPVQNDVAPGGNKAILKLADGRTIVLDSARSGELAKEENATITKTSDGKIVYKINEKLADRLVYNTMITPRGGQYQLTLPDGSQVWLNAESSITYPTAFTGKDRQVSISGEAYFEVSKNKSKPFKVVVNDQTIEVLGTHFNVSAYSNEEYTTTTLLEGSVKILARDARNAVHTSLTLKPGQQGQLSGQKLSLAANPNVERVIAWKNGVFNFNNADLQTVMRQLERWYDIQVSYEGDIPEFEFKGKLPMNLQLSQVLTILRKVEVKYRIEGRKLIVSP